MTKPSEYLRETIDLVRQIETRFLELGARLYAIKDSKLWVGMYDTYAEFLESARISPSQASILASIHKHYIVDGKMKQSTLASIGYSNLYEAIPLIERDGVNAAVIKAETLTRSELKDEVREQKHGEHEHVVGVERWGMCTKCNKFVRLDDKETK